MQAEKEFRERCALRGVSGADLEKALGAAAELAEILESGPSRGPGISAKEAVAGHVARLVSEGRSDPGALIALARYCAVLGETEATIWLLSVISPIGILESHGARLAGLEGEELAKTVMAGVPIPPPGSPPEAYPGATARFMSGLAAALPPDRVRKVLCWNVHGVPAAAFDLEKSRLAELGSVDAWLADRHERELATLERHAADGTLWFEQRITPRVVDFVRENQEILAGRREGDRILATKIPYDPDRWLTETDPGEKRALACHCPLAAATLRARNGTAAQTGDGMAGVDGVDGAPEVPLSWCDCSGGYTKFMFDTVFGTETEATLLESVLAGDDRCRFAISIPEAWL